MLRRFLTLAGASLFLTAAAPARTPIDEDIKAMEGTWQLNAGEVGGQKLPDEVIKSITLILKGEDYTVKSPGPEDKGTVKLDPTSQPKAIDVTGVSGPNQGKTFPAIYELDGDTLKVCYDLSGKARPTEFKSAPGTLHFLATYSRKSE